MTQPKLSTTAGEKVVFSLPDIYSTSFTAVSYLSSDKKVGGKYKDLFNPSIAFISKDETKGTAEVVYDFLLKNYSDEKEILNKKVSLNDRLEFLEIENYSVAPIYKSPEGKYSSIKLDNYKDVGCLITTRTEMSDSIREQADMWVKELNGEDFVFNILYKNTKETPDDLSNPLFAVANTDRVKEELIEAEKYEARRIAKNNWHSMAYMSNEARKSCWADAIVIDAKAFQYAPDDIRRNIWAVTNAIKKTQKPEIILSYIRDDKFQDICESLLKRRIITAEQIPSKNSVDLSKWLNNGKSNDRKEPELEII